MSKPFQFSIRQMLCTVALLGVAAQLAELFIAARLDRLRCLAFRGQSNSLFSSRKEDCFYGQGQRQREAPEPNRRSRTAEAEPPKPNRLGQIGPYALSWDARWEIAAPFEPREENMR
jgi:hypothetical protein